MPVGQGSGDTTLPVVRSPPVCKRRQPGCQSLIESNELVQIAEKAQSPLHTIFLRQILAYREATLKMLSMHGLLLADPERWALATRTLQSLSPGTPCGNRQVLLLLLPLP